MGRCVVGVWVDVWVGVWGDVWVGVWGDVWVDCVGRCVGVWVSHTLQNAIMKFISTNLFEGSIYLCEICIPGIFYIL